MHFYIYTIIKQWFWECGEIGRHDGLQIRCWLNSVRVQVPPFPTNISLFRLKGYSIKYETIRRTKLYQQLFLTIKNISMKNSIFNLALTIFCIFT